MPNVSVSLFVNAIRNQNEKILKSMKKNKLMNTTQCICSYPAGHSERAMLYHDLEGGMYSVNPYFFAKVIGFVARKYKQPS